MATAASISEDCSDIQSKFGTDVDNENDQNVDQIDSLTQESDEILEMFCEHCEQELGTIVPVEGFCVNCLVYMCSTCLRYHQRYKADHTIQDQANMPQDFYIKKCQDHSKELVKFYCMSCQQTACTVCKINDHSGDCVTDHISSLVRSYDLKTEVSNKLKYIGDVLQDIADSKKDIFSKLSDVQSVRQEAIASLTEHKDVLIKDTEDYFRKCDNEHIQKHKREIESYEKKRADLIAKLDREKEELVNNHQLQNKNLQERKKISLNQIKSKKENLDKQSEVYKLKDEKRLQSLSSTADNTELELKNFKQNQSRKMLANQKCEVFLTLNEADNFFQKINLVLGELSQHEISLYRFQAEKVSICHINCYINYGSFQKYTEIRRNFSHLKSINTAHPTDKVCSSITGLCKISDNNLIAADYSNACIKMIDIERNLVSAIINLADRPFEITQVENNTAAVTIPNTKKIQLLSVNQDDGLSIHSEITLHYECYGIAFKRNNFIVGCTEGVQVIERNGNKLIIVRTIAASKIIPKQIALHPNRNELYLIESPLRCVQRITSPVLTKIALADPSIYRKEGNKNVVGLTIDKSGTIYTCTADGHYIVQISDDLQTQHVHKVWLGQSQSLHYCNKENKLYVGTGTGKIMVFNVEMK